MQPAHHPPTGLYQADRAGFAPWSACRTSAAVPIRHMTDGTVIAETRVVIEVNWTFMSDVNELEALKASFRGTLAATERLAGLWERVAALDPHADIAAADLEELGRVSLAHAVAAQALRGFVVTMQTRRGVGAA